MRLNRYLGSMAAAALLAGCVSGPPQSTQTSANASLAQQAPGATEASVRALLSSYEAGPTRETWQKMPGDVPTILERIANNPDEAPFRRARALEVLGWFDASRSVPLLNRMLTDSALHPMIRVGAVHGLARALQGDAAVTAIAPALHDTDAMVRFNAVDALRNIPTASAQAALQAHMAEENDGSVLRILHDALTGKPVMPTLPQGGTVVVPR